MKKGSPAVAAFNAKAAKYQEGLGALAAEQSQLNALDHPAAAAASLAQSAPPTAAGSGSNPKEAEANAALARLRAAAASADYAAFVETLRTCLVNYRQTAAFPQIAATARTTLANATPEKLAAAIQAQGAAAHSEEESTMSKVRLIVNQTPPRVPTPPRGAETYHYGFHPGALTPDYAHADLVSTRELWKGEYVYMDTVPNVFYRSADCEFNPQTKFFFTSRDVPKKKLTDAEIAEVVRLYPGHRGGRADAGRPAPAVARRAGSLGGIARAEQAVGRVLKVGLDLQPSLSGYTLQVVPRKPRPGRRPSPTFYSKQPFAAASMSLIVSSVSSPMLEMRNALPLSLP